MIFFDTSVIVAASYSEHPQHLKCVGRLHSETDVACAAHTLAERWISVSIAVRSAATSLGDAIMIFSTFA